jgi:Rieske Fe-S protein
MVNTPRRRFLTVLGASGVLRAVGACSSRGAPEPLSDVNGGNISDLPLNTLRSVGGLPVAIGRDAGGVYALSLTCTHQSCNMAVDGTVSIYAIFCICHGSLFSPDGAVLGGPALTPLQNFAVQLDDTGTLTIHRGNVVPEGTRTPVV